MDTGVVKSNVSNTAEYITLHHALGLEVPNPKPGYHGFYRNKIREAPGADMPGSVSFSVEAYFALKLLGVSLQHPAMVKAKESILAASGVAQVRIFRRFFLAIFGLVPWAAVPELPPELILLPASAPFSVYNMSAWARLTVVPLLLVSHHRPIFALPNGRSETNTYLDELWCNPENKHVSYSPSLWEPWKTDFVSLAFTLIDNALHAVNGMRTFPCRPYARKRCLDFLFQHQEEDGSWAGYYPPMHASIIALVLEGYDVKSVPAHRGLEGLRGFIWSDQTGRRMQACVSPVWDTILMTIGLLDSGMSRNSKYVLQSTMWLRNRQFLGPQGDWKVFNPRLRSGGFSFEYRNVWTPDVDDTAAAVLSFVKQIPSRLGPKRFSVPLNG